jgi:hypothetical protein
LFDAIRPEGTIAAYVDFEPWFEESDDPADSDHPQIATKQTRFMIG